MLHLYAQPGDPDFLRAQEDFAEEHEWFEVRRLEAHSHFPMLEVPEDLAVAIEEFVVRRACRVARWQGGGMAENEESAAVLSRAIDQTAEAIAAVRDDQLGDPDAVRRVGRRPAGRPPRRGRRPPAGAGARRVARLVGGARPGRRRRRHLPGVGAALLAHVRDQDANADWQLAELAVHTWDLVTATGQATRLDPAVAERGYAFMSSVLKPEMRAGVFGPERPAPADADPYQRIAAFAGREVG